jgi:hypothetical protein
MSPRSCTAVILLALIAFVSTTPPAQSAEKPAVDPRVDEILRATADYLKKAKEFTVHAEITVDDTLPTGQNIQYAASWDAAVKRPDRLRTVYRGDLRNSSTWYDGKTFTMLNTDRNLYASWKAPSSVDSLIDKLNEKLGVRVPLSSLLRSDPYKGMSDGIQSAVYAGLHLAGGTPCHHLLLKQEDIDVQVWIEEGTQLVVRKVVLTFKNVPGDPQFTAVLSDWDFSPRLPEILFSFVPPEEADKIEFIPVGR